MSYVSMLSSHRTSAPAWDMDVAVTTTLRCEAVEVCARSAMMLLVNMQLCQLFNWARGVVVSHPFSIREALGSSPSESMHARWHSYAADVHRIKIKI